MKRLVKKGSTNVTLDIFVQDSSSTTGAGLTGLVFNSSGLVCYYRRGATGTATQLTLATQTVGGAHSDGGFVEISSANMPGMYRLDLSDAIVASGVPYVTLMLKGATNMAPVTMELQLVDFDPEDAADLGLTALTGHTPQTGDSFARLGAPAGASVSADIAAIQSRLPAALVGGRMPSDMEAISGDSTAADNAEAYFDGTGYGHVLLRTTIATLSSQTVFTLTAGSTDNDAYNGCEIVIQDASTSQQKAVGVVLNYVGASRSLELAFDPLVFTMAVGDIVTILASRSLKPDDIAAACLVAIDPLNRALFADLRLWRGVTPLALSGMGANAFVQVDTRMLVGNSQSAADLKNFADAGYDPATNKVQGVVLVDTLTTYTGNTPQTGDSFARIGATGSSLTSLAQAGVCTEARLAELDAANLPADVTAVKSDTAAILLDTGTDGVVVILSAANCNQIADHVRRRTQQNVEASSDGDALSLLSEYGMIQQVQESSLSAGTLTVKQTDGSTTLGTRAVTTDASAEPITGVS